MHVSQNILEAAPAVLGARLTACTDLALKKPGNCAIFLDMDGTLLDLAPTPGSISVPPGLVELLHRVADALDGALAILTGRKIAELDSILSSVRIAASGVHGAEMRMTPDSQVEQMVPALSQDVIAALTRIAERIPGAFAEPKGGGLAIHYRLAPTTGNEIGTALRQFVETRKGEFEVWPGQKVFEIIPSGFNKGTALSRFAAMEPFKHRIPIMIGDDHGDEPAFAAAERMKGFGLKVASENFSTGTDFEGPRAVRAWLARIADTAV
jgi:trehalose 6-phosphate phosphatase